MYSLCVLVCCASGHKNVTNNVEDTVPIVNQFSIEASGDLIINKKEDLINNNNNENDGSLEDENYGLNPSFVNLDINMSVPDGEKRRLFNYLNYYYFFRTRGKYSNVH